jgi:hypothetical protein
MPADQAYLRKCIEDTKGSFPDKLKHQLAQIKKHDKTCADLQTKIDALSQKKLLLAAKQGGKAQLEKAPKRRHAEGGAAGEASTHGSDVKLIQTHGSDDNFLTWALAEVEKLSDEKVRAALLSAGTAADRAPAITASYVVSTGVVRAGPWYPGW